jgi:sugar lactone lactonase YvrE
MGLAVDSSGNLFVADFQNNRVLMYAAPITSGMSATVVLGQTNFGGNGSDLDAVSLNRPADVATDGAGNVYVADQFNSRVLKYTAPITTGMAASVVFGQPNLTTTTTPTTTATSLVMPGGVALDGGGNLYVADTVNNRIVRYTAPFTNGMVASLVFGQLDFTSDDGADIVTASSLFMPTGLFVEGPGTSNLYVADQGNNRVLRYAAPFTTGMDANLVVGQPGFTSDIDNNGGISGRGLSSPSAVAISNGSLYVVDNYNNRVLAYDATPIPCSVIHLPMIRK